MSSTDSRSDDSDVNPDELALRIALEWSKVQTGGNLGSGAMPPLPRRMLFTVEFPTNDDAGEDVQVVGKTPNQGDHNGSDHHGADTDGDVHRSQGDIDNEAHDTGGDLDDNINNEAHSDDDNQDDGHDHDDYADDADVDDTLGT
ncbi:hypothetical protein ZWY2020_041631 [Hordeum vulgare]|nr:hypothetical protein ZWY2020_041631 [Hordeum vulgare]